VVMMAVSGLKSALRKMLHSEQTNCHVSTEGLNIINASQELTFKKI
jgi:hypothetical protein